MQFQFHFITLAETSLRHLDSHTKDQMHATNSLLITNLIHENSQLLSRLFNYVLYIFINSI
jgi:hypothetical protein